MDYNKYIGLPYKSNGREVTGVDCWGLVRLFYKQELDIELPSYVELYSDAASLEVINAIETHRDEWDLVQTGEPGNICLFNIYGEPSHVGVYVGDNRFLHVRDGKDSVVESLQSSQWSKRFAGFYKYRKPSTNLVLAAGIPHPLQMRTVYEWTVAGTTLEDFASFMAKKYSISQRLASRLVILVDGVAVPRDQWSNTVLKQGQTIAYKSIAEGNAGRMILTIAVIVAAAYVGGLAAAEATAAGASAGTAAAVKVGVTIAVNMAGMALINAIAPVRVPQQSDPGQAKGLNLFTGSSNQANRFGPIPVVLGKMRVTGALGATPYIDTLTETSLLNLLIVWGFGPLAVSDLCIGTKPIANFYGTEEFAQDVPRPVTLQGFPEDDSTEFDKLYGRDVEQQQSNVLLVNNAQDGRPWENIVLTQSNTTSIDVAFSFPEGMRQLVISGKEAGQIREATAAVEIQVRKFNETTNSFEDWSARPSYSYGDYSRASPGTAGYQDTIGRVGITSTTDVGDGAYRSEFTALYQWFVYALNDSGEIKRFDGAATNDKNSDPDQNLIRIYQSENYNSLLGADANPYTYSRIPEIPANGYIKLYTICTLGGVVVDTINHLSQYSGHTGLTIKTTSTYEYNPYHSSDSGGEQYTAVGTKVEISAGVIYALSSNQPITGVSQTVFTTRDMAGVTPVATYGTWSNLLKETCVWFGPSSADFDRTVIVNFYYSGYYYVEASADDEGAVYIDSRLVVGIPKPGFSSTVGNLCYLEAGSYPVRITAKNSGGGMAGVGCKITYTENGTLNNLPTPDTVLVFGTPGFYYKRRDAFNFVYKIKNLPPGKYEVRARRVNDDTAEPAEDLRSYNKVVLLSVTGHANPVDSNGNPQRPINKIPNTYLAKTAIRVQSTSKANGTIEGVNAIVQTIAFDWDKSTQQWVLRPTSNPASLFGYVLMHPANAYRIKHEDAYKQIDIAMLQQWHEYCADNGFEFNSVITQTQSVMDVLRDICAAGKASPTFVDGKWSVVIDRPRTYVTQHFTPHNSWGFESTKLLPRLPDAFRITYANASKAYQPDEELIFNFGKTKDTASVFEELSLPGVTNSRQARHLARWHLAQLKLRPEVYSLNVDFEYLVCTRGDLVRVSHDVPLWGTGTGRIRAGGDNWLELSEPVYLEAGKSYQIRVRVNSPSTAPGTDSALMKLAPITTSDWYTKITIIDVLDLRVEEDCLFMLGEFARESQELIVLSVEPADNMSAKLTLADYSPEIYTIDMNSDAELPSFNANITGQSLPVAQMTITQAPIIVGATSSSNLAEEISNGIYQNVLIISFGNVSGLSVHAQLIQVQVVPGDVDFDSIGLSNIYEVDKSAGSLTINGLKSGVIYKIRARYTNKTGSISGPLSDIFYTTSEGKVDNNYTASTLILDLENTYITAIPAVTDNKPADFKTYEYRLYKDTGIEDFWELDPVTNNILVTQSISQGRFNLLDVPKPRISTEGITYRVACRALDNTNNYSATSALGTIVIKTIQ